MGSWYFGASYAAALCFADFTSVPIKSFCFLWGGAGFLSPAPRLDTSLLGFRYILDLPNPEKINELEIRLDYFWGANDG